MLPQCSTCAAMNQYRIKGTSTRTSKLSKIQQKVQILKRCSPVHHINFSLIVKMCVTCIYVKPIFTYIFQAPVILDAVGIVGGSVEREVRQEVEGVC